MSVHYFVQAFSRRSYTFSVDLEVLSLEWFIDKIINQPSFNHVIVGFMKLNTDYIDCLLYTASFQLWSIFEKMINFYKFLSFLHHELYQGTHISNKSFIMENFFEWLGSPTAK